MNARIPQSTRHRPLQSLSIVAATFVCLAACSGCYERVVGVKGPGRDAYDVYEPNLKTQREASRQKAHTVPNKTVPSKIADE